MGCSKNNLALLSLQRKSFSIHIFSCTWGGWGWVSGKEGSQSRECQRSLLFSPILFPLRPLFSRHTLHCRQRLLMFRFFLGRRRILFRRRQTLFCFYLDLRSRRRLLFQFFSCRRRRRPEFRFFLYRRRRRRLLSCNLPYRWRCGLFTFTKCSQPACKWSQNLLFFYFIYFKNCMILGNFVFRKFLYFIVRKLYIGLRWTIKL